MLRLASRRPKLPFQLALRRACIWTEGWKVLLLLTVVGRGRAEVGTVPAAVLPKMRLFPNEVSSRKFRGVEEISELEISIAPLFVRPVDSETGNYPVRPGRLGRLRHRRVLPVNTDRMILTLLPVR